MDTDLERKNLIPTLYSIDQITQCIEYKKMNIQNKTMVEHIYIGYIFLIISEEKTSL